MDEIVSTTTVGPAKQWAMRALAVVAMVGSAVLAYQGGLHGTLPGCGPSSGCDQVLDSEWSRWLGVPVGLPALLLYALMLAATFNISPRRPASQQRIAWAMLWIGAITALGAAIWFSAVQGLLIQAFCKYCLVVHVSGALLALLVLTSVPTQRGLPGDEAATREDQADPERSQGPVSPAEPRQSTAPFENLSAAPPAPTQPRPFNWTQSMGLTLVGLLPVAALMLGQWLMPPASATMQVTFLEGRLGVTPESQPTLGDDDADVWIVSMFDYTCGHCRQMHGYLLQALERYGDQLGIIMLPVPLDADCNSTVQNTRPQHEYACELASLALATWQADPSQFERFDAWLVESAASTDPAAARAKAESLVGAAPLQAALDGGWPTEQIGRNVKAFQVSEARLLPALIVGPRLFMSVPADPDELFRSLESATDLRPIEGTPAADDSQAALLHR